jgi:hypothetical protein
MHGDAKEAIPATKESASVGSLISRRPRASASDPIPGAVLSRAGWVWFVSAFREKCRPRS